MTYTNANVVKIRSKKPRNEELHEILMGRKPGPHKKRNKQKVSRKELMEELDR